MNAPSGERVTEWAGGSLSELMSVLSAAALPARIRVFAPGKGAAPAGEVHLLAGGLNDAFAGNKRGQEAASALQRLAGARFVIDTRLPDPETGSLAKPGPAEGSLAQRPLVEIMRYCEDYVLTCTLEVWRGEEQARISYRRGELVGTSVGGSEAPERLPEVMGWKEGFFEIDLPLPVTPPSPAPSRRTAGSAAVGDSAGTGPARPASGERARRGTDPFITIGAVKRDTPTRPAGAMRSTGEISSRPRLPPGPPLPGFQARIAAAARAHPAEKAGPRPPPFGPTPAHPLAAPPTSKTAPAAQGPLPPLAAPMVVGRDARPAPAPPLAPVPWPTAGTSAAGQKSGHVSGDEAPGRQGATREHSRSYVTEEQRSRPGRIGGQNVPEIVTGGTRPSVAQPTARPISTPAPRAAAGFPTPAQGSAVTPPPSFAPASLLVRAPAAHVQRTPPPAQPASVAAVQPTSAMARPVRPAEPRPSESFRAMREASATSARMTPSEPSLTSGRTKPAFTPPLGTEALPFGVELPEDMQDPAAFVETPPPEVPLVMPSMARSTPTPISPTPQPMVEPPDEFAESASGQPEDLGVDFEEPGFQPDQRPARRGVGAWPLLVHMLLGVALGAAIAAAYSAYYGLPLRWP